MTVRKVLKKARQFIRKKSLILNLEYSSTRIKDKELVKSNKE